MFEVTQLEGTWWGVFLVNPQNKKDRYLVTSPLEKKADAEHFQREFTRIVDKPGEEN